MKRLALALALCLPLSALAQSAAPEDGARAQQRGSFGPGDDRRNERPRASWGGPFWGFGRFSDPCRECRERCTGDEVRPACRRCRWRCGW